MIDYNSKIKINGLLIKFILLVFSIPYLVTFSSGQTFTGFLSELENTTETLRQAKVDSFMLITNSFPITESTQAHFIYKGNGNNPAVVGDFTGWELKNTQMKNVSGTDFWYFTEHFESNARLDYQIVYNDSIWIIDTLNPFTIQGGFGTNSEIRMPDYVPPEGIKFITSIPHGVLEDTIFYSINLDNSRKIIIYNPPGYLNSLESYPVVLVHDGIDYLSFSKIVNVLDFLISEEKIQPLIAIFVPPVDRGPEYIDNKQEAFTSFIIEELIPWVDSKYRTKTDPINRMIMGPSAGGNISLWIAMNHPGIFGQVAPFSPFIENDIQEYFSKSEKIDLRIFLIHGIYDHLDAIQTSVEKFLSVIKLKNYNYTYREYPEGHSWGFWRAHVGDALKFAFPVSVTNIEEDEM